MFAVRALQNISKDTFIAEYIGFMHRTCDFSQKASASDYIFCVDDGDVATAANRVNDTNRK